jgi:hypothetical protein
MVKVITRINEIYETEKFKIYVFINGTPIEVNSNGILGSYNYKNKRSNNSTVADWRRDRFAKTFPGLECQVRYGDGTVAPGHTRLRTVRATYPRRS